MAFVHLKNAGFLTHDRIDFERTEVARLASEERADGLYTQIHKVSFYFKEGDKITVLTKNLASDEECSMSGVTVYVVSATLGRKAKDKP
ncbi:MAG: hypothetical protein SVU69_04420 [Pseudomonadota bacterium]|nr:hypothetical protein [Pseudomonadota bacterium]